MEVIDSIVHVTQDGRWLQSDFDASEARLLAEMDAAAISQAVVIPLPGLIPNEFVLDVCQSHPDRLVPGAAINPAAYSSTDSVRTTVGAVLASDARVIKLHPRLNGYDPLDARCLAVFDELACRSAAPPVWLDGLLYSRHVALRKSLVDTIHELAVSFPSVRLVVLHAGGSWALQLAECIRDCQNVFLDLSFTLLRHAESSVAQDLRYLISTFDRRLIFGSDFPEIRPVAALATFHDLARGLPDDKVENVLSANLRRILTAARR